MLSTSLKGDTQIFVYPPIWIPNPFAWDNYPRALSYIPYLKYFTNTMMIAIFSMIGVVISCSLVAYSLARLRWPGRDLLLRPHPGDDDAALRGDADPALHRLHERSAGSTPSSR